MAGTPDNGVYNTIIAAVGSFGAAVVGAIGTIMVARVNARHRREDPEPSSPANVSEPGVTDKLGEMLVHGTEALLGSLTARIAALEARLTEREDYYQAQLAEAAAREHRDGAMIQRLMARIQVFEMIARDRGWPLPPDVGHPLIEGSRP